MIQSILFFVFGFLCASLLALLVAPPLWRRAVALTRRRIEASMPLTLNEVQADKDALRAEFALSSRRLEVEVEKLKDRLARQTVEMSRRQEELKRLVGEREAADRAIAGLEVKGSELAAALERRAEEAQTLSGEIDEARRQIEQKTNEIEQFAIVRNQASLETSNRQIELAARETEVARLMGDVGMLSDQRKAAERRLRELAVEHRAVQESLKVEAKRAAEFERRLEQTMTTLADRDEALERRGRELARLRALLSDPAAAEASKAGIGAEGGFLAVDEGTGAAELGEAISRLAAEMVAMTAAIEGQGSPIEAVLAEPDPAGPFVEGRPSLAERVRALRQAGAKA